MQIVSRLATGRTFERRHHVVVAEKKFRNFMEGRGTGIDYKGGDPMVCRVVVASMENTAMLLN